MKTGRIRIFARKEVLPTRFIVIVDTDEERAIRLPDKLLKYGFSDTYAVLTLGAYHCPVQKIIFMQFDEFVGVGDL
jgi:hypothetical protein